MSRHVDFFDDKLERIHGKRSEKARIDKTAEASRFPQLTWIFQRRSYSAQRMPNGQPVLKEQWVKSNSTMDFGFENGREVNCLLKAYLADDSRLMEVVKQLVEEDEQRWQERQQGILDEYYQAKEQWEHQQAAEDQKNDENQEDES